MHESPRTLPARYYTDPGFFHDELERRVVGRWFCVGRAEEVAEPGSYVLREIAGESLIVARGQDGVVRAFYNHCRHRGTQICTEPQGRFAGTIQCPYHAWTYDLTGRLVGAPHMDAVAGFRKEDWPLHPVAADVWDGHLFLSLAPDPGPLADQLADLPAKFAPWRMGDLRRAARVRYDVAANWKLILQNYSECLHCPVIHPALQKLSHYLSGENEPANPAYIGGHMTLRDGIATMNGDGQARRPHLPGLGLDECRRVYFYAVLPNLLLSLHPDYLLTHVLWPRAADRTEIDCEWHFDPDAIARPGFDPADAVDFWDMTNRQDWHVSELSQVGISSRAYTPGPYSAREHLLAEFDRLVIGADPR